MSRHFFTERLARRVPLVDQFFGLVIGQSRLANAYVFAGGDHAAKLAVLRELAKSLNCEAPDSRSRPCNQCGNCVQIDHQKHPEVPIIIEAQEDSRTGIIKVEQVTQLLGRITRTSVFHRVVAFTHAESDYLHAESANALLKSIEEAPDRVLFVMFAADKDLVLPTVLSRCQVLNFPARYKAPDYTPLEHLLPDIFAPKSYHHAWTLAKQIAPDHLELLFAYCTEQYGQTGDAIWYARTEHLEQAMSRLGSFCNERAVLEELLLRL